MRGDGCHVISYRVPYRFHDPANPPLWTVSRTVLAVRRTAGGAWTLTRPHGWRLVHLVAVVAAVVAVTLVAVITTTPVLVAIFIVVSLALTTVGAAPVG